MSKVVLLAVNAKYSHSSLSVWVIADGVSRHAALPHDVSIVEATINQPNSEIVDNVAAQEPDIVGVSTYIWNAAKMPGLLEHLRGRLPGAVFVLGGPEASHNAGYWLERGADHVLRGEGEYEFPALLSALAGAAGQSCADGRGRPTPQGCGRRAPAPVDPYTDDYFAALGGRMAYIETSRGCPYRCAFCLSAGSGVRYFPLETVKEQLDRLSRSGAQTIKFVDRTFNCNPDRAYELFEYIIGLDTDRRFHFEVAADLFDERALSLLRTAPPGRIQFEAGLQSFFEPALKAVSRHADLEKAQRNILALLHGGNIHIHIDLIAGLPYETLPDFMDSFDRAYSLGAHTLQLGFLKLLHGSALRKQAGSLGIQYSKEPPYEVQSSPWLSAGDVQTLKQTENALQHTRNKSRFLSSLDYALTASSLRPFTLFNSLGGAAPNHGTQLEDYAGQVYGFCASLPGVDAGKLRDLMTRDWLGMVKGKNMPTFLRSPDSRRKQAAQAAEKRLRRSIRREEAAVLSSGDGIFVDSENRNQVTGLYPVYDA